MARVSYIPQGTAADANALQAAINQAGPGGCVDIAQGRVTLNATVRIGASLTLAGSGPGTVLVRMAGFNGDLLALRAARDVQIRDFSVDDSPSINLMNADVWAYAINVWNCPDSMIENVQMRHCFRGGINVSECNGFTIDRCLVEDSQGTPLEAGGKGGHGITVFAREGQTSRNVVITRCTLRRNWRTGLFIVGSYLVRVEGCGLFDNMPKQAVDAGIEPGGQLGVWTGCSDIVIANNQLDGGVDTQGIEIDVTQNEAQLGPSSAPSSHHIVVMGNTIRNQGRTGMMIYCDPKTVPARRSARVAIVGNVMDNNTRQNNHGYGSITAVRGVSDFTISGNVIREEQQPALKLDGENLRWCVAGNHMETVSSLIPGRRGVFADGNQSASGTTGQVGVGVYVNNGAETLT